MEAAAARARYEPLRIFTFVAQTEVWLIWAIYSVTVFVLMHIASYFILVWWIVIGVPFLQFCMHLIESTARGIERAPRMTWEGFRDLRVYKQLILSTALASAYFTTPVEYRPGAAALILLVCPAMTAFIAMENSLLRALNPIALAGFIWHMGMTYLLLRLVVTSGLLYLLLLFQHQTTLLASIPGKAFFAIASVYLLLIMARSTGALIFSRRKELGIRTVASAEQAEADEDRARQQARDAFLAGVYEMYRSGRAREAWSAIDSRLKKRRYRDEGDYFAEMIRWEDPTLAHKLAQGYLRRLVREAPELAWPILEQIFDQTDDDYRLDAGEPVLTFARFATTSRQKQISLELLRHFDDDFPGHPRCREALLIGTDLACESGDMDLARALFDKVTTMRGLVHKPTFERCLALLRP